MKNMYSVAGGRGQGHIWRWGPILELRTSTPMSHIKLIKNRFVWKTSLLTSYINSASHMSRHRLSKSHLKMFGSQCESHEEHRFRGPHITEPYQECVRRSHTSRTSNADGTYHVCRHSTEPYRERALRRSTSIAPDPKSHTMNVGPKT